MIAPTLPLWHTLLQHARTIAVVGFSPDPERPSNEVAAYLQKRGYRIIPVNPRIAGETHLGERVYASLSEAAAQCGQVIDIADLFRRSEEVRPLVEEAAALGLVCVWMQKGVQDEASAEWARARGMLVVMDRCPKESLEALET